MDIRNLSPRFAISEQLLPRDMTEVATRGFRAVVCNRPDGEAPDQPGWRDLAAEAQQLGLAFAYIPVVPGEVTADQVRELARFLEAAKGPVLGYCRTGARAEKLWERAVTPAVRPGASAP
jgi:sulfide:quinone oxidoreductase